MNRNADQIALARGHLEQYLREKGLPLNRPFRCLNPDHEDKNPSMSYHSRGENVHCFGCGITYDLFDLVGMDYGLESFSDRYQKVCQLFGLSKPVLQYSRVPVPEESSGDRLPELMAIKGDEPVGSSYLQTRGIGQELITRHQVFEADGRVYFPLTDRGKCVGWCGRAIDPHLSPRYRNSGGPLGIWNVDALRRDGRGGRLFVTEGIVDAMTLEQLGETAISICGSQNGGKLIRLCGDEAGRVNSWQLFVCGDGDEAGDRMNALLKKELTALGLSCTEVQLPRGEDINSLYSGDREALLSILAGLEEAGASSDYGGTSAEAALVGFFLEREQRLQRGGIPTGFDSLDGLLDGGLYPGLYIMGAISSLGKTSFALQIADHIAAHSEDVLFFSLEQSRYELIAKSLSRISVQMAGPGVKPFTVREILSGVNASGPDREAFLSDVREAYGASGSRLFIREGMGDIGVAEIRESIRHHLTARGRSPVVVVDYLQILAPADSRATDKQNTDRAVVELKRISRDFSVPVIAVSSFNRDNYRTAASMEAFKESGAVEYSADVLLGLQLQGVGEKSFDVNAAKLREPRKLELVILKNRNGIPFARLPLHYRAKYNFFAEAPPKKQIH